MDKKLLSIVIPAYNEEKNIPLIYQELRKVLEKVADKYDYEIIFVNDGSKDNTWEEIVKLAKKDKKVKGINFSRNFGKEIALTAGIEYAKGDAVITMDADGQRPAILILDFLKRWEEGCEIVYGIRTKMRR
jgi:glycosyltransferase involved in cell wall biosynthesis